MKSPKPKATVRRNLKTSGSPCETQGKTDPCRAIPPQQQNSLFCFDPLSLGSMDRLWVIGDLHGDLDSLNRAIELWKPETERILFIGDYADRGSQGVEVMKRVLQLTREHGDRVIPLRGNHEVYSHDGHPEFKPCHLVTEANEKVPGGWPAFFRDVYLPLSQTLYLAAIVPGEILFVHGGVSTKIKGIADLQHPTPEVEMDVLTSDATIRFAGERRNTWRRSGLWFGATITKQICQRLGVRRVVRGHNHDQARSKPFVMHDGRIVTVLTSRTCSPRPYALQLDPSNWDQATCVRLHDNQRTAFELVDTVIPNPFKPGKSVFDAAKKHVRQPNNP